MRQGEGQPPPPSGQVLGPSPASQTAPLLTSALLGTGHPLLQAPAPAPWQWYQHVPEATASQLACRCDRLAGARGSSWGEVQGGWTPATGTSIARSLSQPLGL